MVYNYNTNDHETELKIACKWLNEIDNDLEKLRKELPFTDCINAVDPIRAKIHCLIDILESLARTRSLDGDTDRDNPFGSLIKDENGKKHLGLINKRADEGDWNDWCESLSNKTMNTTIDNLSIHEILQTKKK